MTNEIIVFDLAAPQQALQVAEILQKFVKEKNLTANIKGKQYPLVEAWQFAGSQLGLYPLLIDTVDLSTTEEKKHKATVEIRRIETDKVISRGVAICSNREYSKKQFDEYAILSMAQTRAEGKAFRMVLAWLMKAAGFEATPAEEMDFEDNGSQNGKYKMPEPKPLISNKAFKEACERIDKGEFDLIDKVQESFTLDPKQLTIIESKKQAV